MKALARRYIVTVAVLFGLYGFVNLYGITKDRLIPLEPGAIPLVHGPINWGYIVPTILLLGAFITFVVHPIER